MVAPLCGIHLDDMYVCGKAYGGRICKISGQQQGGSWI